MKIFTAAQIKEWDEYTIGHEPITSIDLMERAAGTAVDWILQNKQIDTDAFYIFCGQGNNGGDGLAMARKLSGMGKMVGVYILEGMKPSNDFSINFQRLEEVQVSANWIDDSREFPTVPPGAIVIDALFGYGLNRKLSGLSGQLVQHLNSCNNTIISIDLPSGLMADGQTPPYTDEAIIKATTTLTFQQPKLAFLAAENESFIGSWHVLGIGLNKGFYTQTPAAFEMVEAGEMKRAVKPRKRFSHKYTYGHALMLVGSKGMAGAAILGGTACYKSGVGLLGYFLSDEWLLPIFQTEVPEAICLLGKQLDESLVKKHAVAIGSGWLDTPDHRVLLEQVMNMYKGPLVLDATALTIIADHLDWLGKRAPNTTILTPHSGEFDRMFGKAETDVERWHRALEMAQEHGCTIVLKGAYTLTATPEGKGFFNTTGNPGMATAGSGDVLCGIITGICAQGYDVVQACTLGVYLHGLAGDLAAAELSQEAMLAGDIADFLGKAWLALQR